MPFPAKYGSNRTICCGRERGADNMVKVLYAHSGVQRFIPLMGFT